VSLKVVLRNLPGALSAVLLVCGLAACGGGSGTTSESNSATPEHPGKVTYTRFCFSCHAAGVAGAPRVGDADAWRPREAKGMPLLLEATVVGIPPGMPAKGLCITCSDGELTAAIEYMLEQSREEAPAG
jgi:cytochrome c5